MTAWNERLRRNDAKRNIAFARLSRTPDEVDDIIDDLELSAADAEQMRQFAERRNRIRTGIFTP